MTVFTQPLVPPQVLAGVVKVLPCNQSSDTLLWSTRVHRHTRLWKEVASTEGNLCNTELIVDWWNPPNWGASRLAAVSTCFQPGTLVSLKPIEAMMSSQVKIQQTTQLWWHQDSIKYTHIVCIRCILFDFYFLCLTDPPKNVGHLSFIGAGQSFPLCCQSEHSGIVDMAKMRWFPVESVGIDRIWPVFCKISILLLSLCNHDSRSHVCDMYCCYLLLWFSSNPLGEGAANE